MSDTLRDGDILPLQIMARREDWNNGVSIYMRQVILGKTGMKAAPVQMVPHELGNIVEPMLMLPIHTAQQLIDELWDCGLRPTEGSGSAGAMAAVQKHLEDMRKLVFEEPKISTYETH